MSIFLKANTNFTVSISILITHSKIARVEQVDRHICSRDILRSLRCNVNLHSRVLLLWR